MRYLRLFIFWIPFGIVGILCAQDLENNKILRGKVLYQSSNYTPVEGVSISGVIVLEKEEHANTSYTSSKGEYELKFPLARKGHPVKLTIGNTDKTEQLLEVVNEREVALFKIPANAHQEFKVIVCPKGARDVAARRYYKILKSSAEKEYEKMQQEFRALSQAQNKDYNSIRQLANDLSKMQRQLNDSIALYREAYAIASINKDGANRRVLKYLQLLDEGKSIQEARKALSIPMASIDMENSILLFRAGVQELEERARASEAVSDYKNAVMCYDTLIGKVEKLNIDNLELSRYYTQTGNVNTKAGDYKKALKFHHLALDIHLKLLDKNDITLTKTYNAIAFNYLKLEAYAEAFENVSKAIELQRSTAKIHPSVFADSYYVLGLIYLNNKQFTEANTTFSEYQMMYTNQPYTYRNWAMYYALQNQKEEALENLEKAIAQGYKDLQWLETDDSMENLRNEPRFKVLLEKLKE
jgi:tetratricopeptide (TPR) repeat protein